MDMSRLHRETGEAWDATAAKYEREAADDLAMLHAGGSSLLPPERRLLGDLSPWCRRAIHLQCAGGTDTLSLWRQGAAEVVGVDISERMIAVACRKAEALGAPASWHVADVLEAPASLDGTADLVYTGRGALPWMMDVGAWARVVHRLLAPGGRLFVFEGHPLDWVWDASATDYRLDPVNGDYFSRNEGQGRWPTAFIKGLEEAEKDRLRVHERQWTLGAVVNSLLGTGLRMEHLDEHPEPYWNQFPNIPADTLRRLPHTFSLLMRKE